MCDCRSRRIPNALVIAGFAVAMTSTLLHLNPFGLAPGEALLGAAVGLVALLPFFVLRVMGAADVKVFAVLGAWCGMHPLLGLWVAASLAAGVHAMALLLAARPHVAWGGRRAAPTFALAGRRSTPYAACLTVPALAWLAVQFVTGVVS
ncbi:prepilin peptidase [Paraburkholderia bonniea]|uniref:A24 family peptidase n=1 Tax=Paraburkholderia bonniea TaxID=2152891 RepID=UPI00257419F3|nr:prepilin peptidase [Paraburkholderia bonniea]WJF91397.1 prepilin peptidase [Paraburkholderia bonniea]WJF94714.1 prepilin peptidase [Paraburkholderia bonniea]